MRCERARVPTYVWARDPGERRAFSKQESYLPTDGSGYIRVRFGKPLKLRRCRGDRINYPLFGKPSVAKASVRRWVMGFGAMTSSHEGGGRVEFTV